MSKKEISWLLFHVKKNSGLGKNKNPSPPQKKLNDSSQMCRKNTSQQCNKYTIISSTFLFLWNWVFSHYFHIYLVGMHLTGMYFNPAMAFGHMFGCRGTSAGEHFLVYWIGPFIGCYMALILDNKVHIDVTKPKIDEDKKEK